ncbi:hypothetical protein MP228_000873 [Amoeboaphelidium protococcarum]|nr:hypothetical protein MP228_000873 [Amoeboaphelidium protococcarum]
MTITEADQSNKDASIQGDLCHDDCNQEDIVYAQFTFNAEDDDEITIKAGDPVVVICRDEGYDDGWWQGRNIDGEIGLFPSNFVMATPPQLSVSMRDSTINTAANVPPSPQSISAENPEQSLNSTLNSPIDNHQIQSQDDPSKWSVDQVCQWLKRKGFHRFQDAFREQNIDGSVLLSSRIDMTALKQLGLGTLDKRLRLLNYISQLRKNAAQYASLDQNGSSPAMSLNNFKSSMITESSNDIRPLSFESLKSLDKSSQSSMDLFKRLSKENSMSGDGYQSSQVGAPVKPKKKKRKTVKLSVDVRGDVKTLADVLRLPRQSDYITTLGTPKLSGNEAPSPLTCLSASVDFCGYLWKRGGRNHWSWKRRYFVIKDMILWYFKCDNGDSKALGLIPLPSYVIVPSKDNDITRRNYTFEARHPDARTYYFKANSLVEMQSWMNALTQSALGIELNSQRQTVQNQIFNNEDDSCSQKSDINHDASLLNNNQIESDMVNENAQTDSELVREQSSDQDHKQNILNKIKRMGINPLERLPLKLDQLLQEKADEQINVEKPELQTFSDEDHLNCINSICGVQITSLDDLSDFYIIVKYVISLLQRSQSHPVTEVSASWYLRKCIKEPLTRIDCLENANLLWNILQGADCQHVITELQAEKITPKSLVDGDSSKLKTLLDNLRSYIV